MNILPVLFVSLFLLASCGGSTEMAAPAPVKKSPPMDQSEDLARFTSILKPLLMEKCAACHAGALYLENPDAYRSASLPRIKNRSMPTNGRLSDSDYALLVNF